MLNFIFKLFLTLLSIFLFSVIIYEVFSFYFYITSTTSADIVLGSKYFYILLVINITLSTFMNASIFHIMALKLQTIGQKFITFISILSSVLISSPLIYFLLIKVEPNVVKIIWFIIPFGVIVPIISSILVNKFINHSIKPKLLK